MTRTEYAATVATVCTRFGFTMTPAQAAAFSDDVWTMCQTLATSEADFRAKLTDATATVVTSLKDAAQG